MPLLHGFPHVLASLSLVAARLPAESEKALDELQMMQALQTLGEMETLLAQSYTDLRLYSDSPDHLVAIFYAQIERRLLAEASDTIGELAGLKSLDPRIVPELQKCLSESAKRVSVELQELSATGS